MTTVFLQGNSYALAKTYTQSLVLKDSTDEELDCSVSFDEQQVSFETSRDNVVHLIANRSTHVWGGSQQKPIEFAFSVPVYSYDPKDVEESIRQIENFWGAAPGGQVDIYWANETVVGYYAYLKHCLLASILCPRQTGKTLSGISSIQVTVNSLATAWTKVFPGDDPDTAQTIIHGPWVHRSGTHDGSPALVAVRESDSQTLMLLDDTDGTLQLLGALKDNQDLSVYDL